MSDISADQVQELRDQTGLPVMDCKDALKEADGDMDEAIQVLEEKSGKAAAKKAGRDLDAGVVGSYVHNNNTVGAMVELLSETDFVARNEDFQKVARNIAMHVAAMNPQYVRREDVPEDKIEELKDEFAEEFEDKPDDVKEDIIAGKLDDHLSEIVLLEQAYIKDDEKTIQDLVEEATQEFGENTAIGDISRLEI
jgi:elongation factor Ts